MCIFNSVKVSLRHTTRIQYNSGLSLASDLGLVAD
jgi:hypothetical protein